MKKRKSRKEKGKARRKEVDRKGSRIQATPATVAPAAAEEPDDPGPHLRAGDRGPAPRRPSVPPPESDLWPPEYRGARWKRAYGMLFAGKCLLCRYSFPQPESRRRRDQWRRQDTPLLCTNHAARPGELVEVRRTDTCRNFKARYWRHPRKKPEAVTPVPRPPKRKKGVRRIPLTQGLFATVDAADYKEVSKYKWAPARYGTTIYAQTQIHGRTVQMHRLLMHPRKGYIVDHIDGNGLNNCRSNLRVVTPMQNQANRRPRSGSSSRFVGVSRCGERWAAWITHRGKRYWLGTYDDEVEAAQARDRKAVELHGVYAYLNFPQDWTFDKHGVGRPVRRTCRRSKP